MKLFLLLTLLVAVAVAADPDARHPLRHQNRKTERPQHHTGKNARIAVARRPADAPAGYRVSTGNPSVKRSKAKLAAVPSDLDSKRRRLRRASESLLHVRQSVPTYFECPAGNPAPAEADCQVVTDNVYNTNQTLVVTQNACLVFTYQTCKGFFCALCSDLDTTTDFIGNQLNDAEALCLDDGYDASIVGEDDPQWDAGFVSANEGLPTYDVCS